MSQEFPFEHFELDEPPHMVSYTNRWSWLKTVPDHYWIFALFVDGVGQLSCEGIDYRITPGKAYLIAPGSKVIGKSDDGSGMSNFSLHFTPKSAFAIEDVGKYQNVLVRNQALMHQLVHQCSLIASDKRPGSQQLAKQYVRTILEQFWWDAGNNNPKSVEDTIIQLAYEIKTNPGREWSIEMISKRIGLARSQANVRFKEIHGKSPAQYVIDARIRTAKNLLSNSSFRVDEITELLGYRDIYFFSRQFKSKTGFSPIAFRKKK